MSSMSRLGLCLIFASLVQLSTTQTPNECMFGGVSYGEGAAVGGCLGLRCLGGQWMPTGAIDPNCSSCDVFWDPHFITFDGYYYRVQIPCRFALAQPGTSQQPEFGVFAQFVLCNNRGTCVGPTTLLDSGTMVEVGRDGLNFDNIARLYVNDELYTLGGGQAQAVSENILAWRDGECVRLAGTSGLAVEACPYHVAVWAHPDAQDINGLCGQYNHNITDDLLGRTGHQFPLSSWSVPSFGFSWMTSNQTSELCIFSKRQTSPMPDECTMDDVGVLQLAGICHNFIANVVLENTTLDVAQLDVLTEACAFDMCLVSQASGGDNAIMEAWLRDTVEPYVVRLILEQLRTLVCDSDGVSYQQGDTISVNCAFSICDQGDWLPTHTVDPQCCEASGVLHQTGHTISVDCLTHSCVDGDWQSSTQPHPSCCEFDGALYGDGELLPDQCFLVSCHQGNWTREGWQTNAACRPCYVYWDPHFWTFDYQDYMYHSQCNYSLTQPDSSTAPSYGVFATFVSCLGDGTCVEHVTFKNGPNTVLEIGGIHSLYNSKETITVNGDEYELPVDEITQVVGSSGTHPVLAWRSLEYGEEYSSKRIVGSNGLSVEIWPNSVYIFAFPVELHGLCGNNNDDITDEYTGRNGIVYPPTDWAINFFALTWQTVDQTSPTCAGPLRNLRQAQAPPDPCVVDDIIRADNFELCQATVASILEGNDLISEKKAEALARACEFDLCMVYMNSSGDPTAIAAYLRDTIAPVVSHDLELANSTVVIDPIITTTTPGTDISFPPGFNQQIIIQVNQVCNCNEENKGG